MVYRISLYKIWSGGLLAVMLDSDGPAPDQTPNDDADRASKRLLENRRESGTTSYGRIDEQELNVKTDSCSTRIARPRVRCWLRTEPGRASQLETPGLQLEVSASGAANSRSGARERTGVAASTPGANADRSSFSIATCDLVHKPRSRTVSSRSQEVVAAVVCETRWSGLRRSAEVICALSNTREGKRIQGRPFK